TPKSTSVSVSPSGEIVEGGSVTLTCSSNANPPVQRYTWFKKNDTGVWQTGSGQSLNVSNFRSWNSEQYYCEAENKHGVHNSTALSITTKGEKSLMVAICASAGITALVTLVLVAVTVWMCKRKKGGTPRARERGADTQACPNPDNDTYTALNLNDVSSDYDTLPACPNPDNDTYTALNLNDVSSDYDTLTDNTGPVNSCVSGMPLSPAGPQEMATENQEENHYGNIQRPHNNQAAKTRNQEKSTTVHNPYPQSEDDNQYTSIQFPQSSAAPR
ncbi:hypothetical protein AAFF_G00191550, partial [Aldrovandia affinis]